MKQNQQGNKTKQIFFSGQYGRSWCLFLHCHIIKKSAEKLKKFVLSYITKVLDL